MLITSNKDCGIVFSVLCLQCLALCICKTYIADWLPKITETEKVETEIETEKSESETKLKKIRIFLQQY